MTVRLLQAVTSVRVGEGKGLGAMDLPVSRERHTRWPFLPGSSLKGALRSRAEVLLSAPPAALTSLFGSPPPPDGERALAFDEPELEMGSLRVSAATSSG